MMSRQFLSNVNKIYKDLTKYHTQVSTGRAFQKASEAPIRAVKSMDVSSNLQRTELYEKNIEEAQIILSEQEVAISNISDSLVKVQGILQQALNTTYNDNDKDNMSLVIDGVKENIMSLLNKDYAGKHVFGGYNTSSAPLVFDETGVKYNNVNILDIDKDGYDTFVEGQTINYNTGKSTKVDVSVSALELVGHGEDNLFNLLDKINEELRNPSGNNDVLNEYLGKINGYFDNTQSVRTSVGAKISNMDMLSNQISEYKNNLTTLLSQVRDVDIEEAVINYKTSEMVYEAALAVGAKMIQPTLVDFLR